ncbi:prepilin peptidase [Permianibacter sp. IMCC34836]|uniref:prepilin peptidase n=1 Tax=Permianibacter fluminis TaxID=2738515 RepID=UPI0015520B38|nr:A24 family peptidase [Permianibacter fluminis]NQD37028.1 prepilin peptidase [Permianibacter fluminis]
MTLLDLFGGDRVFFTVAAGIFGLLIGSFLNVVIFRLPIILQRQWQAQARELIVEGGCSFNGEYRDNYPSDFGLVMPRSACPHCGYAIPGWLNIPLLSWLFLRGKCKQCKDPISVRYPIIEAMTGAAFAFAAAEFGPDGLLFGAMLFTALLIAMAGIDWDTKLLPDQLTYPLLWLGLLFNMSGGFVPLNDAVIGAVAGYLSLWSVYWAFKLLTGKEGMGYGDFKLFAALGAWLGWQQLPIIIILAAVAGLVIGGSMVLFSRNNDRQIPFGPYLAIAGWCSLYFGADWMSAYLRASGL